MKHPRSFARLAAVSAVGIYLLIVMGAVVRVSGSGLGCPDWPLCHGQWLPPPDFHAIIEYVHRTIAAFVGIPLILLLVAAWRGQRGDRLIFRAVNLMMVLLVPQVLLGREVVLRELPPMLVAVHLALALLIMALAVAIVVTAANRASPTDDRFPRSLGWTVVGAFLLLLTGAYMRASGASWVCQGAVACFGGRLVDIHMLHRIAATVVGAAIVYQGLRIGGLWGRAAAAAAIAQFSI